MDDPIYGALKYGFIPVDAPSVDSTNSAATTAG
jgi:hypothetical protein